MEIRPLTPTEQKYTYAQSMQIEGQTGTIGHLRGDFATTGYGFYTTWFDTDPNGNRTNLRQTLIPSSMPCGRIRDFCTTVMIWVLLQGNILKVRCKEIIVRNMVFVWTQESTLFYFGAIPPKAIITFTVIAM